VNKNVMIVLGVAFGAAILVATLMRSALTAGEDRVLIMMTARAVPAGAFISERDVEWAAWPENAVPEGAIEQTPDVMEEIAGLRSRRDMLQGEIMLASSLVSPDRGFLSAALPQGMRAVAIPVSAQTAVGGFVQPGSFVDIVLTYEVELTNRETREAAMRVVSRRAAETLLRRVRVLAVDQRVRGDDQEAQVGRTVTVAVTETQAEFLAVAQQMGELSLTLRGVEDGLEDMDRPDGGDGLDELAGFTTDLEVAGALREALFIALQEMHEREVREALQTQTTTPTAATNSSPNVTSIIRVYSGNDVSEFQVLGN